METKGFEPSARLAGLVQLICERLGTAVGALDDVGFEVVDLAEGSGTDQDRIARSVGFAAGVYAVDDVMLAYVWSGTEEEALAAAERVACG